MGIAERKERERLRRREEIIDAAEKVFFDKGVEKATMDDVAEAAELSKGTLYLYFKSKQDLYLAIHWRGTQILKKMFADAVAHHQRGLDKVRAVGDAYFAYYKKYPDYFNAMLHYESHGFDLSDPESPACLCAMEGMEVLNILVDAIQRGIDDGSIRPDTDPLKTALVLWAQSTGIIQTIATKGADILASRGVDPASIVEYSYDMVARALGNK